MASIKTVIVTGASQGIGAAVVQAFLGRGYNVVATSRSVSKAGFAPSPNLALVDGDIGQAATAANIAQTAISKFGSIDSLVNNAGVFLVKPSSASTSPGVRCSRTRISVFFGRPTRLPSLDTVRFREVRSLRQEYLDIRIWTLIQDTLTRKDCSDETRIATPPPSAPLLILREDR